jgi:hypothetical protein
VPRLLACTVEARGTAAVAGSAQPLPAMRGARRVSAAKAYIAIKLPPTREWVLLRSDSELPSDYVVIGSLTVGAKDAPLLEAPATTALERLRRLLGASPALCEHCPLRAKLIESGSL